MKAPQILISCVKLDLALYCGTRKNANVATSELLSMACDHFLLMHTGKILSLCFQHTGVTFVNCDPFRVASLLLVVGMIGMVKDSLMRERTCTMGTQ